MIERSPGTGCIAPGPCKSAEEIEFGKFAEMALGEIPARMRWAQAGREGTSVHAVRAKFPDDDAVLEHLFRIRFAGRVCCQICGHRVTLYRTRNFRRYSGHCCKDVYRTPTTDTLFDRTRIPLTSWLQVMLYFANSKTGISTSMTGRLLGFGKGMAFKTNDRIRTHMALLENGRTVGGTGLRVGISFNTIRGVRNKGSGSNARPLVMAIYDARHVVTVIIPNRRIGTITPIILSRVHPQSVLVYQDERALRHLSGHGYHRVLARTFPFEPLEKYTGINGTIQVYWMHLRRALRDNHVHYASNFLWKYLNEFNFRFNRRHRSHETFWDMVCAFPSIAANVHPGIADSFADGHSRSLKC